MLHQKRIPCRLLFCPELISTANSGMTSAALLQTERKRKRIAPPYFSLSNYQTFVLWRSLDVGVNLAQHLQDKHLKANRKTQITRPCLVLQISAFSAFIAQSKDNRIKRKQNKCTKLFHQNCNCCKKSQKYVMFDHVADNSSSIQIDF